MKTGTFFTVLSNLFGRVLRRVSMRPPAGLSSVLPVLALLLVPGAVRAHEVAPAIIDMSVAQGRLELVMRLNLEAILAGVDQSVYADTNNAPQAPSYDRLRAMPEPMLAEQGRAAWPDIAARIRLEAEGEALPLTLESLVVDPSDFSELPRYTIATVTAPVPASGQVVFSWDKGLGNVVLRQQGVETPYTGYLEAGAASDPIDLGASGQGWRGALTFVPVGFGLILPAGVLHILFVVAALVIAPRRGPLLAQAQVIVVAVPLGVVLPLSLPPVLLSLVMGASLVVLAVDTIAGDAMHRWRVPLVALFGVGHGLALSGEVAALGQLPALTGAALGIALGLAVVAVVVGALVLLAARTGAWYRPVIAVPASAGVLVIGLWQMAQPLLG